MQCSRIVSTVVVFERSHCKIDCSITVEITDPSHRNAKFTTDAENIGHITVVVRDFLSREDHDGDVHEQDENRSRVGTAVVIACRAHRDILHSIAV